MKFELDTYTQKDVFKNVLSDFGNIIKEFLKDNDEEFYENLDWMELAFLFYSNGYVHGAGEYMENPEFAEAIKLFMDEIAYQKKYNNK